MDRINSILRHPLFAECIHNNKVAEADRCFCHHDIEHFLAVARISMLLNLEEGRGIAKDLVYAAALLHDCGRFKQYSEGIPHHKASISFAIQILPECGYEKGEIECIVSAIDSHRGSLTEKRESVLSDILYRADKMSRNCQFCKVYNECNWPEEQKEQELYF